MTVAQSGAATGTLTVTPPSAGRGKQVYSFGTGVCNMAGSVNVNTGAFTITGGTAPDDFTVTGTLPVPGNGNIGGTYNLRVGGQDYPGIFGTTVPAPTPSPTIPAPNPSPSAPPANGAWAFTLLSKSADCNFEASGASGLQVTEATYSPSPVADSYGFLAQLKAGRTQFTLNWSRLNRKPIAPETFTFIPSANFGAFGDDFQGSLSTIVAPVGNTSGGA